MIDLYKQHAIVRCTLRKRAKTDRPTLAIYGILYLIKRHDHI